MMRGRFVALMTQHIPVALVLLVLLGALRADAAAQTTSAPDAEFTQTASALFDTIPLLIKLNLSTEKLSAGLESLGLRPVETSWEQMDSTGTVRAFDLTDLDLGWSVVFFPSSRVPLADPVLAALLRDASMVKLSHIGGAEILLGETKRVEFDESLALIRESVNLEGAIVIWRMIEVRW